MVGKEHREVMGLATRRGRVIAGLLAVVAAAGMGLLAIGLFPADLPAPENPGFIDTIFHNRGVIWAARILLLSAAGVLAVGGVFIVASTVIRMKNGEWLRRAGPFEVSETTVSEIEGQIEFWRQTALIGQEEVEELTGQLAQFGELVERLQGLLDEKMTGGIASGSPGQFTEGEP